MPLSEPNKAQPLYIERTYTGEPQQTPPLTTHKRNAGSDMPTATDSRTMTISPSGLQHHSISFMRHQGQAASRWLALPLALNLRTMMLIQISNPAVNERHLPIQVRYKKTRVHFCSFEKTSTISKGWELIYGKRKDDGNYTDYRHERIYIYCKADVGAGASFRRCGNPESSQEQ